MLPPICLTLTCVAACFHAAASAGRADSAPSELEVMREQSRTFMQLWSGDNWEAAETCFATPAVFKQAARQSGYRRVPPMTMRSNHMKVDMPENGNVQLVWTTFWSFAGDDTEAAGMAGPPARDLALLVTAESFTYGNDLKIVGYSYADITDEARKTLVASQEENAVILNDPAQPRIRRFGAGLLIFVSYWQAADYQQLWPHLNALLDMGIQDEPEAMARLQELTRRAIRQGTVPPSRQQLVDRVLKWNAPTND